MSSTKDFSNALYSIVDGELRSELKLVVQDKPTRAGKPEIGAGFCQSAKKLVLACSHLPLLPLVLIYLEKSTSFTSRFNA